MTDLIPVPVALPPVPPPLDPEFIVSGHHALADALAQRTAWVPRIGDDPTPVSWRQARMAAAHEVRWRFLPPDWEPRSSCGCCELAPACVMYVGAHGWVIAEPHWPTHEAAWWSYREPMMLTSRLLEVERTAYGVSERLREARRVYRGER